MTTVDWDQLFDNHEPVVEYSSDPVSPGTHVCSVEDAEWAMSSTGKKMLNIVLAVAEGPEKGRLVWGNVVVQNPDDKPSAIGYMFKKFKALGLTKERLEAMTDTEQEDHILGNRVKAKITHQVWKGETRANIKDLDAVEDDGQKLKAPTPPPRPY